MNVQRIILVLALSTIMSFPKPGFVQEAPSPTMDIVIVLDNSGSMKANDPEFLTKEVVSNFCSGLSDDSRISFVVFAEQSELTLPLTFVSEEQIDLVVSKTLDRVNYSGKYTDIPAGIERATYELSENGRAGVEKVIIFITDGIIDTGQTNRDIEKRRWLKEGLANEINIAGIRIFGIAFTDKADFELIQTLGQKTNGGYYRAFGAEDIQGVFSGIQETISKQRPSSDSFYQRFSNRMIDIPMEILFSAIAVLALTVFGFGARAHRKRTKAEVGSRSRMPEAYLLDLTEATEEPSITLAKSLTTLGRDENNDVCIPRETVSAIHAAIEFKDNDFFLVDKRSFNGTYLNDAKERLSSDDAIALKNGDLIICDQFKFEFNLVGQGKRGGTMLAQPFLKGLTVVRPDDAGDESDTASSIAGVPDEVVSNDPDIGQDYGDRDRETEPMSDRDRVTETLVN